MAYTGVVAKWRDDRGFGFITPDEGGPEVFVHQTEIKADGYRNLDEGEPVEYDTTTENGKVKAINVTGPRGANVRGMRDGGGGKGYGGGGGGGKGKGKGGDDGCFKCGRVGHWSRECPEGDGGGRGRDRYDDRGGGGGYDRGGYGDRGGGGGYGDRGGGYDDRRGGGGYDDRRGGDRYADRDRGDRGSSRYAPY